MTIPLHLSELKRKRRKPKRLEQALHIAVMDYLRLQYPNLLAFHVPNSAKRGPVEGAMFKRMGVLAGVADLIIAWGGYITTTPGWMPTMNCGAIELKAGKGKKQVTQLMFEKRWRAVGGHYAVVRSLDELQAVLKEWGVPR